MADGMRRLSIAALILAGCLPALAQQPPQPERAVVAPGSARAWALLSSAVLFEHEDGRHDLLAGMEAGRDAPEEARRLIKSSFGIETSAQLLEQLEWLRNAGHRGDFANGFAEVVELSDREFEKLVEAPETSGERRKVLATYRKHAARWKQLKPGLLAFDAARYVALCRWAYAANWITEDEAWKRMERMVPALQKAYASWDELGEAYCIGLDCWNQRANQEAWKALEKLRTSETSPWRTTPWKLKLVPLERVPKPAKK